nr:zinc finger, CCHC-type [Tanacetum cinerariifolium]
MVATFDEHEQQENQDNLNEIFEEKDKDAKPPISTDTFGSNDGNDSRTSGSETPEKGVVDNGIERDKALTEALTEYRIGCLQYKLFVHHEEDASFGLARLAFKKGTPQQTANVHHVYSPKDECPLFINEEIFSLISGSFDVPVFLDNKCVGILEFVMTKPTHSYDAEINEICEALKFSQYFNASGGLWEALASFRPMGEEGISELSRNQTLTPTAYASENQPNQTVNIAVADDCFNHNSFQRALILRLGDWVLWEVTKETTASEIWKKLETSYMTKSLANHLYLKKKLYTFNMHPGKSQSEHIDEFHKLTLLYDRDILKLEDMLAILNSRELQKITEAKGDGGEGLRDYLIDFKKYDGGNILLGDGTECRVRETGKVQVQIRDGSRFVLDNVRYVPKLRQNLISLGTLEKESFTMKMQSGKIKVIKGSLVVLSGTRRANCSEEHLKRDCPRYNNKKSQSFVRNKNHVSGSADGRDYLIDFKKYDGGNILLGDGTECRVRETGKVQVQIRDGSRFVLDNVRYVPKLRQNLISLGTLEKESFTMKMQSGKIKVIKGSLVVLSGTRRANCVYTLDGQAVSKKTLKGRKQLGEYQTGWKIKMGNVLVFVIRGLGLHNNVRRVGSPNIWVLQGYRSRIEDTTMSTYLVNKVWVQVLQGVEFEVKPQEDHAFEEEPQGNVGHIAGSQEVQTQNLLDYHSACDMEQHSACKLFMYREDNNEAAFAVAEAGKIYAHKSLSFNDTVTCEVISKWKTILKEEMDAQSDVYVLSNGYDMVFLANARARSRLPRVCWIKQREMYLTLLEGHSILSLEGSLSWDCDVEKNGKWSCIYAVGSQEYQMVCTRPDIASTYVGTLDGFDRRLQTDVQVLWIVTTPWALSTTEAAYMTLTKAAKEAIWLKGLAIESGFKLKIVAGIATGAFSKAIPSSRDGWSSQLPMEPTQATDTSLPEIYNNQLAFVNSILDSESDG